MAARGLEHDRRWMVVDTQGRFLTQRELPRMALITTRLTVDDLVLGAPGMPDLAVPLRSEGGDAAPVSVWSDATTGTPAGLEADRWLGAFLGVSCRLVRMPGDAVRQVDRAYAREGEQVGYADGFPFLLISQASLDDLNRRLSAPVGMERFRPNLVVSGCAPYAEDGWTRIRIGAVLFRVVTSCARCVIVTVDPSTGERGREPLRTLAGYRTVEKRVLLGQNLIHDSIGGVLRVGDAVEVLEMPGDGEGR